MKFIVKKGLLSILTMKSHDVCFLLQPKGIRFHVRSLGWVEMEDSDLSPGKSSLAVNNCIRQLSYRKTDIRDVAGIWGEVRSKPFTRAPSFFIISDELSGFYFQLIFILTDHLFQQLHSSWYYLVVISKTDLGKI